MIVFTPSSMGEGGDTSKNDYFEFRVPLRAAITSHASYTGGTAPPRCSRGEILPVKNGL
jgi:hypothetical protein